MQAQRLPPWPSLTPHPTSGLCWQVLGVSQEPGRLSSQLHEIHHQPVVPPFPVHRRLRTFGNAALWRPVRTQQRVQFLLPWGLAQGPHTHTPAPTCHTQYPQRQRPTSLVHTALLAAWMPRPLSQTERTLGTTQVSFWGTEMLEILPWRQDADKPCPQDTWWGANEKCLCSPTGLISMKGLLLPTSTPFQQQ